MNNYTLYILWSSGVWTKETIVAHNLDEASAHAQSIVDSLYAGKYETWLVQ